MEKINQNINFYKPPFKKIPKKINAQSVLGVCVATAAVLGGLTFMLDKNIEKDTIEIAEKQGRVVNIKRETESLRSEIKDLIETQQIQLDNDLQVVQSVNKELKRRLQIYERSAGRFFVNEISGFYSALGRQAVNGLWLEQFELSPASGRVSLAGKATSPALVPEYVSKLTGDEAFKGFNFHTADIKKSQEEASLINFKLESVPEAVTP